MEIPISKGVKPLKIIILIIALSLSACATNNDSSVNNSIDRLIKNEQTDNPLVVPILTIYISKCMPPKPPETASLLSYELALRDSVVSFKACRTKYYTLIEQVQLKNKEILGDPDL